MCAGAVLASTSFAVSAHVNIKLPTGQTKPVSNWFWCVAESGERKTATDDHAFAPQKQHEKTAPRRAQSGAWKTTTCARRCGRRRSKAIEKQFKDPGAAGSEAHQKELESSSVPNRRSRSALIMASDFTFEGMVQCLNLGQPLYGIIGSEGGQFIGGHGMTDEAKLRTITGLSAAWDGEPIKRVQGEGNRHSLRPARRHASHGAARSRGHRSRRRAADQAGLHVADSGVCAREPDRQADAQSSAAGSRAGPATIQGPHAEHHGDAVSARTRHAKRAQRRAMCRSPRKPPTLFWEFADEAEKQMAPGGDYDSIRAFAAKLPEHAARLGATIAAYRDLNFTELSREDFLRGMQIAVYYATEAKRISGASTASSELSPAQKLPPARNCSTGFSTTGPSPPSAREISIPTGLAPSGIGRARPRPGRNSGRSTAGSSPSRRAGAT